MTTQTDQSTPLAEEPFFPTQERLPADAVEQVRRLSRSLFGRAADMFAQLEDWRLHANHPFPGAKGYSPHHCLACGLIERCTELLFAYSRRVGAFVRRVLRDPAAGEQVTAAARLYAWVVVQFYKELGLTRDPGVQLTRAARLLYELAPERFVEAQWADEIGSVVWEEEPLLFALDEAMATCVQEFAEAYTSLVRSFDAWREANPTLCPALFAWVEGDAV